LTARACGDRLNGLHFYEGGERQEDLKVKTAGLIKAYDELMQVRQRLEAKGLNTGALLTSGTPAFPVALKYKGFKGIDHRVGPGTTVFWDTTSSKFTLGKGFVFAASVLTRVNSRPTDHSFTCDAGSKALAAESTWPIACVAGKNSWVGRHPSEEHFPFDAPKGDAPAAGSLLELHPMHVCPTVNLAEVAMLMEGDKPVKLVSVAARAHAAGPL